MPSWITSGNKLPEVVAVSHVYGCSQIGDDLKQTRRVLEEFAAHPNVGAVLLIGLGCETMPTVEMSDQLAARGVTVQRLMIQDEGGSRATAARGTRHRARVDARGIQGRARAHPAFRS